MIIDLIKNRESLIQAWKDVLDDQSDTNWALFGYEGQTNSLKVIGRGSQGIEELVEDLNSGKIMYAFVKVNDPKTSLPKFVLINWQGEGANTVRKGICANHLRDVESFFTGAHLTITARNEEEVEPDLIISRISKSGSTYSFNVPRSDTSGIKTSVGSNYQRINPVKEINASERDQFWLKEEQEENQRQADERRRKEIIVKETFPKKKEYLEIDKSNPAATEKITNEIVPTKEFEIITLHDERGHCSDTNMDNTKKVNQSELLRQQRNKEAQDLIAQRTFDARSIFENSTSTGQLKYTPQKPIRSSLFKTQLPQNEYSSQSNSVDSKCNIQESDQSQKKLFEEQLSDDDSDQFSTIKRSPRDPEKKSEFTSLSTSEEHGKTSSNICNDKYITSNHLQHITDQQFVDEVIYQEFNDGPGLQAKALYDYEAADDTEITFDPGDIITNIDQVDEGWWQGLGPDGTYGLFPANYVELIE